jgi:hypothetical protein
MVGKNSEGRTVADIAPYAVKSSHSRAEPSALLNAARFAMGETGSVSLWPCAFLMS